LVTIHTPHRAGFEHYPLEFFDDLELDRETYGPKFIKNSWIDFGWAAVEMADMVSAVSEELAGILKEMFPQHASKIVGVRNGSDQEFWRSERLKLAGDNLDPFQLWINFLPDQNDLFDLIESLSGIRLSRQKPTMGWVRRILEYKNQIMVRSIIRAICAERGEWVDTSYGRLAGLGMQMFGAGLLAEESCRSWLDEFHNWTRDAQLQGKFVFIEKYFLELLKKAAAGCLFWLSCPKKKLEGCGTSDQRAAICGNVPIVSWTGGPIEYVKHFDPQTGQGNGFFIDPDNPLTLYEVAKICSDLYYNWVEKGDAGLLKLKWNAFQAGKQLDIAQMLGVYRQRIFNPLLGVGGS